MIIIRPTQEMVMRRVGAAYVRPEDGCEAQIALPRRDDTREWFRDHSAWAVHIHLPEIRPHALAWRLAAEAYLTRVRFTGHQRTRAEIELEHVWGSNTTREWSFEQALCDGSSGLWVRDLEYPHADIKDPAGVAHDFGYALHRIGLADVHGHRWGLCELHTAYAAIMRAGGRPVVAARRHLGLLLFGWTAWGGHPPEPVESVEWRGVSDNRLSKWATGNIVYNGHVPFRSRGISEPPRTGFT